MKTIKVLLDFISLSIALKITFYRNVIKQLKANVDLFVNPDSNLVDATTVVDNLEKAYEEVLQTGGHFNTVTMHKVEAGADKIFRVLAHYVDRIADGDAAKILLGGYDPSNQPSIFQKALLNVLDGPNSGSVTLVAKAVDRAGSYIWQWVEKANAGDPKAWINAGFSTQATFTITGLTPGTIYYFRMAAVTPDGVTDFIAPVIKIVI